MIAARFRTVGWVAGVASAALGCYLVSQSVAAERAGLARVDARIVATRLDIHRLTTEIGTRGRMSQLDRWNTEVLALQAPGVRQFVASEVQLASLNGPRPLPIDPDVAAARGAVEKAGYAPPPASAAPAPTPLPVAAAAIPAEPLLRPATYVRTRPHPLEEAAVPLKVSLERKAPPADFDAAPVAKAASAGSVPAKAAPEKTAPAKPLRIALDTSVAAETSRPAAKPKRAAPIGLLPADIDSLVAAERTAGKAKR